MTIFFYAWKGYAREDFPTRSWLVKEWKSFSKKRPRPPSFLVNTRGSARGWGAGDSESFRESRTFSSFESCLWWHVGFGEGAERCTRGACAPQKSRLNGFRSTDPLISGLSPVLMRVIQVARRTRCASASSCSCRRFACLRRRSCTKTNSSLLLPSTRTSSFVR